MRAKRLNLRGEFFQNQRFTEFRRKPGQARSQRVGAFLAEQRIHMASHGRVFDASIDPVAIKKERYISVSC